MSPEAEWFGDIPVRFTIAPVKQLFDIQLGKMLQTKPRSQADSPHRYLRAANVQWNQVIFDSDWERRMFLNDRELAQFRVSAGDVLVCEGGEGGRAGRVLEDFGDIIIQNSLYRVSSKSGSDTLNSYLVRVFEAAAGFGWFAAINNKATFAHFTKSKISSLHIPVPEDYELQLICRFLDNVELQIARAIQAKLKTLALLEELGQQAILQALRGDCASMKTDSRVDWLGPFPAHWDLVRLGSVLRERAEQNWKGEVKQVLSLVRKRGVLLYEDKGNIGNKKSDDIGRYKIVRTGDIVLNSMNVIIGSVGMSRYEGCLSPVYYVLTTRDPAQSTSFFNELFQIERFHKSLVRFGKGILAHRLRISMLDLKSVMVPLPPNDEQHLIADRVRAATGAINSAMDSIRREVDLLREYRTRLIADVVTGKKDVRAEAANLPDVDPLELANVLGGVSTIEDDVNEEVSAGAD